MHNNEHNNIGDEMSFLDSIRDLLGGAGEQAGSIAEDVTSQIPGADQA